MSTRRFRVCAPIVVAALGVLSLVSTATLAQTAKPDDYLT
jgi:hypothetical protein